MLGEALIRHLEFILIRFEYHIDHIFISSAMKASVITKHKTNIPEECGTQYFQMHIA